MNDFVAEDGTPLHPPVAPVFFAFRIMVGVGLLMLAVSWVGAWSLWRRDGFDRLNRWVPIVLVGMTFSGWVATLAGWYTTEIGRQPWLVQGVLPTAEAVSTVPAPMVASTLMLYLGLYAVLLIAYVGVLFHLARRAATGKPTGPGVATGLPAPGMITHAAE